MILVPVARLSVLVLVRDIGSGMPHGVPRMDVRMPGTENVWRTVCAAVGLVPVVVSVGASPMDCSMSACAVGVRTSSVWKRGHDIRR